MGWTEHGLSEFTHDLSQGFGESISTPDGASHSPYVKGKPCSMESLVPDCFVLHIALIPQAIFASQTRKQPDSFQLVG